MQVLLKFAAITRSDMELRRVEPLLNAMHGCLGGTETDSNVPTLSLRVNTVEEPVYSNAVGWCSTASRVFCRHVLSVASAEWYIRE